MGAVESSEKNRLIRLFATSTGLERPLGSKQSIGVSTGLKERASKSLSNRDSLNLQPRNDGCVPYKGYRLSRTSMAYFERCLGEVLEGWPFISLPASPHRFRASHRFLYIRGGIGQDGPSMLRLMPPTYRVDVSVSFPHVSMILVRRGSDSTRKNVLPEVAS